MIDKSLTELTIEYLKAQGYRKKNTVIKNAYLFSRPTGLGSDDEWLIYIQEADENEEYLKENLQELDNRYGYIPKSHGKAKNGRRFFLSAQPLGIVPQFISTYGFKYQVPIWFFDREFSSEKKSTPLKTLEENAKEYIEGRIEQPFEGDETGDDLLNYLLAELDNPKEPCLRIIIAPAGYGKTVLMASLYTKLKERFLSRKKAQKSGMRPLLMLPGHIKRASDIEDLINNFIGDEYDYGVSSKEQFMFWVKNNFGIWLLDGLEEIIVKIPDEFLLKLLDEYLLAPDAQAPQIVISIRKPLLTSCPELKESIEEWKEYGIKIYELSNWQDAHKIKYFEKNLNLPPDRREEFYKTDLKNKVLSKITQVPYYCKIIADLKNDENPVNIRDEYELVEYAIKKICEREYRKGIDEEILPLETQNELFLTIAEEMWEGNRITAETLENYVDILLPDGLSIDVKNEQVEHMKRHALLTHSGEEYDFVQDILKQYFQAKVLLDKLFGFNLNIFTKKEIEKDSFLMGFLVARSSELDWSRLSYYLFELEDNSTEAKGFRNLLKILLAQRISKIETLIKLHLNNKNLKGLTFKNLNLNEANFAGSNLEEVRFENCSLEKANLSGCNFKNTYFSSDCKLEGAKVEDAHFDSIVVDIGSLNKVKHIREWFYEKTKVKIQRQPCQAVVNLRKVLKRIAKKGKGFELPVKFLKEVTCTGGISASECVDESIRAKILVKTGERIKIKIDRFDEVNDFIKGKKYSDSIVKLLDNLCKEKGCDHGISKTS